MKSKKNSEASKRGRRNRINGKRAEDSLKKMLISWGLECDKVKGSGALKGGRYATTKGEIDVDVIMSSDVWVQINGDVYQIESKRKGDSNGWHRKFDKLPEDIDVIYIENFCYFMRQDTFRNIINGDRPSCVEVPDEGFKALHKFFDQDSADIVAVYKPSYPWLFALSIDTYKKLTGG